MWIHNSQKKKKSILQRFEAMLLDIYMFYGNAKTLIPYGPLYIMEKSEPKADKGSGTLKQPDCLQ